jgi:hypothetical protein
MNVAVTTETLSIFALLLSAQEAFCLLTKTYHGGPYLPAVRSPHQDS